MNGFRPMVVWERDYVSTFFKLALPSILTNVVSSSLHIVDNIMVGRLGTPQLAAVTQVNRVFFVYILFVIGFCSGSSIFIAQFWGVKDVKNIRKVQGLSLIAALMVAMVFVAISLLIPNKLMSIFINDAETMDYALAYLPIIAINFVVLAISRSYGFSLRTTQQVNLPMVAGIISICLNVALNWALIFGNLGAPALGVRGAAIASVISASIECAILIVYTYKWRLPSAIAIRDVLVHDLVFLRKYIKTIWPVVLNEGVWAVGSSMFGVVFGFMGRDVVAAFSIYGNIEQIGFMLNDGLVHASTVVIGMAVGQDKKDQAYLYGKRSMLITVALASSMVGLMLLFRGPIVNYYNVDPAVKSMAMNITLAATIVIPFFSFCWVNIVGVLRAGGDTFFAMCIDVGGMWLIALPLAFFAGLFLNLPPHLVFLMYNIELLIKAGVGMWRFTTKKWMVNLVRN